VRSLERAIHTGSIGARRGRTTEEMAAISGALSLLANLVMAWNTQHIQGMARKMREQFPDDLLCQIAPVGHAYINMRGIFNFDIGPHRRTLLGVEQPRPARKAAV